VNAVDNTDKTKIDGKISGADLKKTRRGLFVASLTKKIRGIKGGGKGAMKEPRRDAPSDHKKTHCKLVAGAEHQLNRGKSQGIQETLERK